jgi:hypothetical protein
MVRRNKFLRKVTRHPKTSGAIVLIASSVVAFLAFGGQYNSNPDAYDKSGSKYDASSSSSSSQTDKSPKPGSDTKPDPVPRNTSTGKKEVSPVVTYANQDGDNIVIRAYVSGIFEDGGTCKATLTLAGESVSSTSKGFGNVSYTSCKSIVVARNQFSSAGNWSLVMKYSSKTAGGSSSAQTVKIE